jgi:hypothetical protein
MTGGASQPSEYGRGPLYPRWHPHGERFTAGWLYPCAQLHAIKV